MERSRRRERPGMVRDEGRGHNRQNLKTRVMSLGFIIRIMENHWEILSRVVMTGFSFFKNPSGCPEKIVDRQGESKDTSLEIIIDFQMRLVMAWTRIGSMEVGGMHGF